MVKQESSEESEDKQPSAETARVGGITDSKDRPQERDPWDTFRFGRYRGLERRLIIPTEEQAEPSEYTEDRDKEKADGDKQ